MARVEACSHQHCTVTERGRHIERAGSTHPYPSLGGRRRRSRRVEDDRPRVVARPRMLPVLLPPEDLLVNVGSDLPPTHVSESLRSKLDCSRRARGPDEDARELLAKHRLGPCRVDIHDGVICSTAEATEVAERERRAEGRDANWKTSNHRGLATTPTDGGDKMCGRITQNVELETLVAKYGVQKHPQLDLSADYNGAPGQDFVAVRNQGGVRVLEELRWGRIPEWAEGKPRPGGSSTRGPKRCTRNRRSGRHSGSAGASSR